MKKYYKVLFLPAMVIIIAGIFSGFGGQSDRQAVEELLQQRTTILQKAYYDKMDSEKAEAYLKKIETYPLLSEDIQCLRDMEATDMDRIQSMDFLEVEQTSKYFDYISFNLEILWNMQGPDGKYSCSNSYSVVIKSQNGKYRLSEFNAQ